MSLEESINNLADAIRYFADRVFPDDLPRPQPFTIKLVSERRELNMDFLKYEAALPAVPPNTDVTAQVLVVSVEGTPQAPQELGKDASIAVFEVPQGSNVELSLTYVDDSGNSSAPRTQSFVAVDTIAPDAPGPFGEIQLIGERTDGEGSEPVPPVAPVEPN